MTTVSAANSVLQFPAKQKRAGYQPHVMWNGISAGNLTLVSMILSVFRATFFAEATL